MKSVSDIASLLDVDDTLLGSNRVQGDFHVDLASQWGCESRDRCWDIAEVFCVRLGCADYLGAPQRYQLGSMHNLLLLQMSAVPQDTQSPAGYGQTHSVQSNSAVAAN